MSGLNNTRKQPKAPLLLMLVERKMELVSKCYVTLTKRVRVTLGRSNILSRGEGWKEKKGAETLQVTTTM